MDSFRSTSPSEPHAASASEERALLTRLRGGDNAAFEELVRTHMPRMLAVARRFMHDETDAQDAVQDAFLSAFKAIGSFEGGSSLGTWLHSIIVRACLMKLRTKRRHDESSIEELLPQFQADGHRVNPGKRWSAPLEDVVQREEGRALVRRCIEQLPETHRTILLLRDIEEYDTDETAKLLDVSQSVVKTRLHRARQALRTLLDPYFGGDQ
jgi:RNA polymerase sigma-70 factor (ECF subfamily)